MEHGWTQSVTEQLEANVVMQQCARWYHTRYHLQRLCTWYRTRFHVLAYRGRGIKFTTMCAKRASGCKVATTRTGSVPVPLYVVPHPVDHVRDSAMCVVSTAVPLRYHCGTMNNRSAGHGIGGV